MVHLPRTNAMAYDLSDTPLPPKYSAEIKLNAQKIEDLQCLSQSIVGEPYENCWKEFFSRQAKLDNFEETDSESDEPIEKDSEINDSDSDVNYDMDRIYTLDEKVRRKK